MLFFYVDSYCYLSEISRPIDLPVVGLPYIYLDKTVQALVCSSYLSSMFFTNNTNNKNNNNKWLSEDYNLGY